MYLKEAPELKQPNLVKGHHDKSTELGCPKSQWHVSMDECSQFTKSTFYKNKFVEDFCKYITRIENRGLKWKRSGWIIRMKTKKLLVQAKDSDWRLSFQAEFTARNTPQQNGVVEVKIATIAGRARSMGNAAHMDNETRHYIANEVLSHSTDLDLDNLIVDKLHTKTRYERFGLPVPKWAEMGQIKTFGEAGVVKRGRGKGSKLQDRGVSMMFVGYAENHAHDCYRMWNPATKN
jgi:hypothetical protein